MVGVRAVVGAGVLCLVLVVGVALVVGATGRWRSAVVGVGGAVGRCWLVLVVKAESAPSVFYRCCR